MRGKYKPIGDRKNKSQVFGLKENCNIYRTKYELIKVDFDMAFLVSDLSF